MAQNLQQIIQQIKLDPMNLAYTQNHIAPLFIVSPAAKILVIGQAPGKAAQDTHMVWNDVSGKRLRSWMGISRDAFYHSGKIAVLPMDFYYPGKSKGGDLPPRKDFAAKWHQQLRAQMPQIQLTLLVGSYAIRHYLHLKNNLRLTDIIKDYQHYLPTYFPLVHPSPRNQRWLTRNSWFENQVIPELQQRVDAILNN